MSKKKYRIITIVGARPQFIKAAALSQSLLSSPLLTETLIHTGQHYDHRLSQIFFDELNLQEPAVNLEIGSVSPLQQIAQIIIKLEQVFQDFSPNMVIVFGDTNSTLAAAVAAAKMNIPLAHVESGMREFKKTVPEEINKLVTDAVSDIYFASTKTSVDNLRNEGKHEQVFLVGDISLDLIVQQKRKIEAAKNRVLNHFNIHSGRFCLFTCHRVENTVNKENLENILRAISQIDRPIIFPIHPRTSKAIKQFSLAEYLEHSNIIPSKPLDFYSTQALIKNAYCSFSDSGGIIKESYFHQTPCIIVDTQTEWIESLAEGWSILAGPKTADILRAYQNIKIPENQGMALGNGTAGQQITQIIEKYLLEHVQK